MERRKKKRRKERANRESPAHVGPSKFVCDLLMVTSLKCATKCEEAKLRKELVTKSHLRATDLSSRPTTSPVQCQTMNLSADKSSSSILKISVDLMPVLTSAMQPLQTDETEVSFDRLEHEEGQHTDEHKTLTKVRSIAVNQRVHNLDKPLQRTFLPPLKSHFTQPLNYCLKHHNALPPIAVSEKHPLGFAHATSTREDKMEETTQLTTQLTADSAKNNLNQNMASQLHLPDISVSSIQMLIERVERQLDRGKVKLPEITLHQDEGQQDEMSTRKSCSPPLIRRHMNQPAIIRFQKKTRNLAWSVNTSSLQ
ncbi:hypothetical protein ACEWY4_014996 [Coilia grayii]|uniref:Uncharacterized protein n=1 Tax=Coilia grayii TaxID=363190 RepID=A0ABD1JTU0_9TELE